MSRRHWRFVVRDQYGYALQNAHVNVYQPNTTTAFTGNAYTADSGGSAVTNPMTTDSQGTVQAWFDNAQSVDVAVDDNNDTAYRATDGSGVPISFTPFTVRDAVNPEGADVRSDTFAVGVAGDLVKALNDPFTSQAAAAGSVGKWADSGHTHPFTALTPSAPAADATTAAVGTATAPAHGDHVHPVYSGTVKPSITSQFTLSNTAVETVIDTMTLPANSVAAGSTFRISVPCYITNSTTARTLEFRVRWGGVAGVVIGAVLSLVGTTTTKTDLPTIVEALVTIRTIGATGTAVAEITGVTLFTTTSATVPELKVSAKTAAATIDTTASKDLVVTAAWTVADATVTLTVDAASIEQVV